MGEKKPSLRLIARVYVFAGLLLIGLALFGEIRISHPHGYIWPTHSHYLLPTMFAGMGWLCLGIGVICVIAWLLGAGREKEAG